MVHELRIKNEIRKGIKLLLSKPCNDDYLAQLVRYLFEHRGDIPYILKILQDETTREYGGNLMYTKMEGPTIFIYEGYDEEAEEFGIRINRSDLIEIFKAWHEINQVNDARSGIKEMILQRDEEHISIIVYYEDGSEFRRTFNYKVKE